MKAQRLLIAGGLGLLTLLFVTPGAMAQRQANPRWEPDDPRGELPAESAAAWESVPPGLHGAVGSVDLRYARDVVPELPGETTWTGAASRGERVHAQLVLWSAEALAQVRLQVLPLTAQDGDALPVECITPRFVRYVLADDVLVADVLDDAKRIDMPARSARPIWVSIDVPQDAKPGMHTGRVIVKAAGGTQLIFNLELEVLPLVLPPAKDWFFHLDLWQNPFAVARYHHVELWSEEHFRLMEPHLRLLADAGQKCLTTTIIYRPWGTQTFDPYDSMVHWSRRRDGSWAFDYSDFDRYVEFGLSCGINRSINCYSMVPWTNRVRFFDEATGDYDFVEFEAGDETFTELWSAFLPDFSEHLRRKNWLGMTAIAMDERPLHMMEPTIALVREVAPQLKIALAGSNEPALKDAVDDWCIYISPSIAQEIISERNAAIARPLQTTFYVCCVPNRPNTFTFSPPAESAWIGLYAAARDMTGFLRWAYDSWTEDPLHDTKHVTWAAGDCFLVYPGARTSIRFERLREGIQDYEKIRLLRKWVALAEIPQVAALNDALNRFSYKAANDGPAADEVNDAKAAIEALSRAVAAGGTR